MRNRFSTLAVVEGGVAVALSLVLSMIKVFEMPQGGSVTAGSMLPILFVALRHGPRVGILAGTALGILQYMVEPFYVHPLQVFLDYPLAFGLLGLAGLTPRQPWSGIFLGIFGRFAAHVLSGVVFFAEYTPPGQSPWVYSAVYNGSYLLPELLVAMGLLTVLFVHPAFARLRLPRQV